jgi:hypothetical protein
MPQRRILYIITTPEDKILHHIIWNQQEHPSALFAIVATNPMTDQWLQQKNVECSLVHGNLPFSPDRLENFLHVMEAPFFQDFTIPNSRFAFVENIPIDRLLQFFHRESREKEREVLEPVDFDELICSLDMDSPIVHFLLRKAIKRGLPTTAIQCNEIRRFEMLDMSLRFSKYVVDMEDDRDFLVRELGVEIDKIEVIGKTLFDSLENVKDQILRVSNSMAEEHKINNHGRGVFLVYDRRHNWEIRRLLRIMNQMESEDPERLMLYIYCEDDADTDEFQTLFQNETNRINYQILKGKVDITVLNHCFPVYLGFRWNRNLEIAGKISGHVILFDPFDFNCTSRMGIDETIYKIVRNDDALYEFLQKLPVEVSK